MMDCEYTSTIYEVDEDGAVNTPAGGGVLFQDVLTIENTESDSDGDLSQHRPSRKRTKVERGSDVGKKPGLRIPVKRPPSSQKTRTIRTPSIFDVYNF